MVTWTGWASASAACTARSWRRTSPRASAAFSWRRSGVDGSTSAVSPRRSAVPVTTAATGAPVAAAGPRGSALGGVVPGAPLRTASGCGAGAAPAPRNRRSSAAWAASRPAGGGLVRDVAQQMADDVEPSPPLVVGVRDVPGRPGGVGRTEHVVARAGVVVPPAVGLQVHPGQLPDLARVVVAALQPPRLLLRADLEPVLEQDDSRVDDRPLDPGHGLQ